MLANNASTNRRCHINNQTQQQRWSCCVSPCQRHRGWSMTAAGQQVYSSASCAVPRLISGCVFSWWMTGAGRRQHQGGRGREGWREDDEGEERAAAPQWLNTSLQTWDAQPDQKTPQADETQHPLLQAVDYFRVKMSCFTWAGVGGSVCYTQRFSVNSAFITIMVQCQQCFLGLFRN